MSKRIATEALNRMNLREVLLCSTYGGLINDMQELASADSSLENAAAATRRDEMASLYGFTGRDETKPFVYHDGVAIIPVHGTLINRFSYSWSFATGYNFIRSQLNAAADDEDVKVIVFDVNSYGGEAAGCFELATEIASVSKPTIAVIDSNGLSAAYGVICGCDVIVCTPSGWVGSIGVLAQHIDISEALKKIGMKVTIIAEGEHKGDGNPYEPLPKEVLADIRASVTKRYGEFVDLVARNRGLDSQAIRDQQSRSYRADDALALKLIDKVATPAEAVSEFLAELGAELPAEEDDGETMSTTAPANGSEPAKTETASAPDTTKIAADAAAAERARFGGIIGCEEAKGRESLANHLATNTDMTVEQAKATLAASPKEGATTKPAAEGEKKPEGDTSTADKAHGNAFQTAMSSTENPNVGSDPKAAPGGEKTPESATAAILASQHKATGRPTTETKH